ncbi:hypothetical protein PsorP6_013319 [Peronosclerospora sorghi]|uniref:Uncharacterized protein n=1 Tax=Peronosclerospora sorghi TaxID=230839 RepID=A0ACC0WFK7_9STRA|nr:hypothetical protein PsorP6_013319 [Peronosclerospora sorghi]
MSFRSLLEAAMGDAQALPQDQIGQLDAEFSMMGNDDRNYDVTHPKVLYSLWPDDESDDAFLPQSSDEEVVLIEEDSDIERQLWEILASVEDEEVADDDGVGANGVSRPRK